MPSTHSNDFHSKSSLPFCLNPAIKFPEYPKKERHASQSVRVEFTDPEAAAVAIAGTFNDWRPEATPMIALGAGRWLKELVLPPGIYEYLLVADGQWVPDPLAKETAPNPFGGVNSVVRLANGAHPPPGKGASTKSGRRTNP
jgi:1,4-alpha-glucan branching enzyme